MVPVAMPELPPDPQLYAEVWHDSHHRGAKMRVEAVNTIQVGKLNEVFKEPSKTSDTPRANPLMGVPATSSGEHAASGSPLQAVEAPAGRIFPNVIVGNPDWLYTYEVAANNDARQERPWQDILRREQEHRMPASQTAESTRNILSFIRQWNRRLVSLGTNETIYLNSISVDMLRQLTDKEFDAVADYVNEYPDKISMSPEAKRIYKVRDFYKRLRAEPTQPSLDSIFGDTDESEIPDSKESGNDFSQTAVVSPELSKNVKSERISMSPNYDDTDVTSARYLNQDINGYPIKEDIMADDPKEEEGEEEVQMANNVTVESGHADQPAYVGAAEI